MKVLTLIGNGFDLGHGLPTRFSKFIASNPIVYQGKYAALRKGNNDWNEIESQYEILLRKVMKNRSWQYLTEEVERITRDYGLNEYGEVNLFGYSFEAYDEEFEKIADLVALLGEFEKEFQAYLRVFCNDEIVKSLRKRELLSKILKESDLTVTFNYTHTAEVLYGANNVVHIHGDMDDSIAIGSGAMEDAKESTVDYEYPELGSFEKSKEGLIEARQYYTEDMDGRLVEDHFVRRFFDGVTAEVYDREQELFNLLDLKSKDSMDERQDVIETLRSKHFDRVHIIGHSLGEADHSVFDSIDKDAHIIYYYHGDERLQKEAILSNWGFKYEMVSDEILYR